MTSELDVVRPWKLEGHRAYHGGRILRSQDAVAIQSPLKGNGWELYLIDSTGLELFAGYAPPAARELLDTALVALLDAGREIAA